MTPLPGAVIHHSQPLNFWAELRGGYNPNRVGVQQRLFLLVFSVVIHLDEWEKLHCFSREQFFFLVMFRLKCNGFLSELFPWVSKILGKSVDSDYPVQYTSFLILRSHFAIFECFGLHFLLSAHRHSAFGKLHLPKCCAHWSHNLWTAVW